MPEENVGVRCRELLRETAIAHEMIIHAGSVNHDHVHMLPSIPPNLSVSRAVQYLKGRSSRKLLSEFGILRKRYWGRAPDIAVVEPSRIIISSQPLRWSAPANRRRRVRDARRRGYFPPAFVGFATQHNALSPKRTQLALEAVSKVSANLGRAAFGLRPASRGAIFRDFLSSTRAIS